MATIRKVFGAVLIGVGTIFGAKRKPDDHWSTPPTAVVDSEAGEDASGEPEIPT